MQKPVQIAYHQIAPRPDLNERIQARAARLERYFDRIIGCKVTLEGPGRHHRMGKHFRVRIEIGVPGETLVVGRNPTASRPGQDLRAAIDVAFREARRQLEDHARRRDHRLHPQAHAEPARGRVARIFPQDGYGFLATPDGRELFFDRRAVLGDAFARLRVGTPVRFAEELGDEGPQASSLAPAGRSRAGA